MQEPDTGYQGWIEANLIFVAPDEVGRVQTLSVREGDTVKTGDPLFTVDDDLQQADLAQVKASLTNAQQTYDRASMLLRTGAGTQKDYDAAEAVLRDAQARLNSSQTRLSRRTRFSPVDGTVQQIYFRPGEMVPADRPVLSCCRRATSKRVFTCRRKCCPASATATKSKSAATVAPSDLTAHVSFIARQSEFTPPVIYSLDERSKLVFLIEALPNKPGEPACWSADRRYVCLARRRLRRSRRRRDERARRTGHRSHGAAPDIVIDVHGLTKSFGGRQVVRNLSMQVKRGTIFGFLGPNGSGKTTTIRMLCGLLTPDEGGGTCLGYDIRTEAAKIKTRVGYMTQRFSLYEDLSVRENLEFVARIYGMRAAGRCGQGDDRAAWPARPRGAGRRQAFRRLETAARARRLHAAESAACYCSTSRPPASTPRRGAISGARFIGSPPTASPCSSPRITWTKLSAATRSPISLSAKCLPAARCMR